MNPQLASSSVLSSSRLINNAAALIDPTEHADPLEQMRDTVVRRHRATTCYTKGRGCPKRHRQDLAPFEEARDINAQKRGRLRQPPHCTTARVERMGSPVSSRRSTTDRA